MGEREEWGKDAGTCGEGIMEIGEAGSGGMAEACEERRKVGGLRRQ